MSETLTIWGLLGTWALMVGWMGLCTWQERQQRVADRTDGTDATDRSDAKGECP